MNGTDLVARCLGAALACTLVVASVLTAVPANAKVPRAPHRYSAAIEGLAGYSPQRTCSPWAKPGTTAFATMLLRTYRTSRSLGIVRSCGVGGTSEHKEGRAFDWGVSVHDAQQRRSVNALMRWLLRKDRHGNRYAMARRLGIQYMIWNRRIWGSYAASSGWRRYTGASPHTDHVHFSLSWKGARKLTSFWRPRRFGKKAPRPPQPRPQPAPRRKPTPKPEPAPRRTPTPKPEPSGKPLPEPRSPRVLQDGPALVDEHVALPTRSRAGVTTRGALQQGHEYLVEVSGTYRYAKNRQAVADGECSAARRSQWRRDRSLGGDSRLDHLDVYIDGHDLYADSDNGEPCDTDTHTYRWTYQADRDGRVPLRVWDPVRHGDNAGRLSVHVLDLGVVRDRMRWKVPAAAPAGVTSPGSLREGVEYELTVGGVWRAGGGHRADAECSIATSDPTWRRDRSAVPADPHADHFDVLLDKSGLRLDPVVDTGGRCNTEDHTYRYTFTPSQTRPVNLRVDDPHSHADNVGALRVRVAPYVPPAPRTEQVTVDSRNATPVRTQQSYPAGTELRLRVSGTYEWRSWIRADAECAQYRHDGRWSGWDNYLGGRGDVTVDGVASTWWPNDGHGTCDEDDHGYWRDVTVDDAGPLSFAVADDDHSDNSGSLTVVVEPR